jgi:hypothetical protein
MEEQIKFGKEDGKLRIGEFARMLREGITLEKKLEEAKKRHAVIERQTAPILKVDPDCVSAKEPLIKYQKECDELKTAYDSKILGIRDYLSKKETPIQLFIEPMYEEQFRLSIIAPKMMKKRMAYKALKYLLKFTEITKDREDFEYYYHPGARGFFKRSIKEELELEKKIEWSREDRLLKKHQCEMETDICWYKIAVYYKHTHDSVLDHKTYEGVVKYLAELCKDTSLSLEFEYSP